MPNRLPSTATNKSVESAYNDGLPSGRAIPMSCTLNAVDATSRSNVSLVPMSQLLSVRQSPMMCSFVFTTPGLDVVTTIFPREPGMLRLART
eukprot:686988-Prymnesium_polylepis.1